MTNLETKALAKATEKKKNSGSDEKKDTRVIF